MTKTTRDKLDKIFSQYIRLLYADDNGWVACYTCGKVVSWRYIQNGHFAKRAHKNTRFDEENCKPQCENCNEHKDGCEKIFAVKLDEEYHKGKAEELKQLSKQEKHFTHAELEALIAHYKQEVAKLKKEKGL